MDWWAFFESMVRRVPFEKILVPPRDNTKGLQEIMAAMQGGESVTQAAQAEETSITPQKPQGVAYSGSTGVVVREGVDAERLAWQDGIIRGELWLLEGHLKNNCQGCGGDVECCFKHCQNVLDATRETQSMTTDPLYREAVALAERIQPLVLPDDIRTGKYITYYPPLSLEVSKIRTLFDKRVMGRVRPPITLEEAKQLAAEEAAKEVERQWPSQEKT
jgi:hypothetical protein